MKTAADLKSCTPEELKERIEALGEPGYRAGQIFSWLHQKNAASWDEMSDLPKKLREKLSEEYPLENVQTVRRQESAIDGTVKYLFALSDQNLIESVLMRYRFGNSVCVSSQVGCAMGCAFCASTLGGLIRNLTAGEMLEQVYAIERELGEGERVSHVVVMGSGEPMENYDEVIRFFRLFADPAGRKLSMRNMTISTCGIVPGIRRLSQEGIPVNLAISLHAPNDGIRTKIMPAAKIYPMEELMSACRDYFRMTGRRLTWEYALIRGVNDGKEHALELADRIRGVPGVVNLIPVNPVKERGLKEPAAEQVRRFQKILTDHGAEATIRRTLGRDIDGACGQLRRKNMILNNNV